MPARLFTDIKPIKCEQSTNHYKQSHSMDSNVGLFFTINAILTFKDFHSMLQDVCLDVGNHSLQVAGLPV